MREDDLTQQADAVLPQGDEPITPPYSPYIPPMVVEPLGLYELPPSTFSQSAQEEVRHGPPGFPDPPSYMAMPTLDDFWAFDMITEPDQSQQAVNQPTFSSTGNTAPNIEEALINLHLVPPGQQKDTTAERTRSAPSKTAAATRRSARIRARQGTRIATGNHILRGGGKINKRRGDERNPLCITELHAVPISLGQAQEILMTAGVPLTDNLKQQLEEAVSTDIQPQRCNQQVGPSIVQGDERDNVSG